MGTGFLVPFLVAIIVLVIVIYALKELFKALNTPASIQNLIFLVVLVAALVFLGNYFGVL